MDQISDKISQMFDPASNSFWDVLLAGVVLVGSIFAARYARRVIRRRLRAYEGVDEYAGAMIGRIAGWAVVFLGVVFALSVLGVDMVPVVLIIVLFAAFLFLSARSLIENWAAGLLLQSRAPYRPGDRIETLGYVGDVELTNVRSVVLRTPDGRIIHVPNVDVLQNPMVNQTGDEAGRRSSLDFGVAFDTDLAAAEQILLQAAAAVTGVSQDPKPTAWVSSMGDTTIVLELRFWHTYADRHVVPSAVVHEALGRLTAAGVSLPFPTQELRITGQVDETTSEDATS